MEFKLFYLGEIVNMPEEQKRVAEEFIKGLEYGIIATNNPETGARLSALNNLTGQTLQQLHFGTDPKSQKVKNIQSDSRCEIMYTNAGGGQIMISGKAEIINDPEIKKTLWQPWMDEYSPEGTNGDGVCIIRVTPELIRAMIG